MTREQLEQSIRTQLPTNGVGLIAAVNTRQVATDIADYIDDEMNSKVPVGMSRFSDYAVFNNQNGDYLFYMYPAEVNPARAGLMTSEDKQYLNNLKSSVIPGINQHINGILSAVTDLQNNKQNKLTVNNPIYLTNDTLSLQDSSGNQINSIISTASEWANAQNKTLANVELLKQMLFTKSEVNSILDAYYNKSEIDSTLSNYYTKSYVDTNYYNKNQTNTLLNNFYSKDYIDDLASNYYRKQDVDDEPTNESKNLVTSGGVYKSTPTVADSASDTDLDISDEQGNVLVRFAEGHLQVKNFSTADALESIQAILSNIGFDNVPEFSEEDDYAVGDIVRYGKYVYVFTSTHTAGVWNESEVEKTVINIINTEHPVKVTDSESESDLDISDENGNVLVRCKNGNIKTKYFDSSQIIGEEQMANILTNIQNLNTRVDNVEDIISTAKGIILDTDWWTDVDDAVAIRCLLWAERCGLVDLVGVCVDAINSTSGKSIAAFLNEEGRGGLAIGMDKQATDYNGNPSYHSTCINNWRYYDNILSNNDCEDCVSFYRRALVNSSKKIDIICIGYGNALQRLLNSTSDSISPLTGRELIAAKVNKLWWMAGKYPNGSENNFNRTSRSRAAGADICTNWPTPIVFLGFEVGETVISGNNLSADVNSNDLLYKCLVAHGSGNGRSSWDPMTVLLACYDNLDIAGYTIIQGINSVDASTGSNTFTVNNQGKHYYVVKKYSDWWYAHQINTIISLTSWPSRKLGSQQIDKL